MTKFDTPFFKLHPEYAAKNYVAAQTVISGPGAVALRKLLAGHAIPPEQECMATDVFMELYPEVTQSIVDAFEQDWNQRPSPPSSSVGLLLMGRLEKLMMPIVQEALSPLIDHPDHRNWASVIIASWIRASILPIYPRAPLLKALQRLWDAAPDILAVAEEKQRRGDFKLDWIDVDQFAWMTVYADYCAKFNKNLDEEISIYADHLACGGTSALVIATMQAQLWENNRQGEQGT